MLKQQHVNISPSLCLCIGMDSEAFRVTRHSRRSRLGRRGRFCKWQDVLGCFLIRLPGVLGRMDRTGYGRQAAPLGYEDRWDQLMRKFAQMPRSHHRYYPNQNQSSTLRLVVGENHVLTDRRLRRQSLPPL